MLARIAMLATLLLSLVLLPGCPGGASELVGTWVLRFNGEDHGVMLQENGQATSFKIDGMLLGTLNWRVDGDQFVMDQNTNTGIRAIYSALISNDGTRLDGALVVWMGQTIGQSYIFTADKA